MLKKITDFWPGLLSQSQEQGSDQENPNDEDEDDEEEDNESIEETFKNQRWTRVISLRDYKEQST